MLAKILNALSAIKDLILSILFPAPISAMPAIPSTSSESDMAANPEKEMIQTIERSMTQSLDEKLISALIHVESGGNDYAIGDRNLSNMAYGPLQIRQPYVDDVNRIHGTSYLASDLLGNRNLSIWIFDRYMDIYATKSRLGRQATLQDQARIHNGGPNGWKNPNTVPYWQRVQKYL